MDISRGGDLLFVVQLQSARRHGAILSIVVATEPMIEVVRIPTCINAARVASERTGNKTLFGVHDGRHARGDDTHSFAGLAPLPANQREGVGKGRTSAARTAAAGMPEMKHMDMSGHGMEAPKQGDNSCSPTWAQPSASGASIFGACNQSSEIVEVDAAKWSVVRRIPARPGVYNLAITKDGTRLVATNKRDQSVSVFDIKSGKELARLPTKRRYCTVWSFHQTTPTRSSRSKGSAQSRARSRS